MVVQGYVLIWPSGSCSVAWSPGLTSTILPATLVPSRSFRASVVAGGVAVVAAGLGFASAGRATGTSIAIVAAAAVTATILRARHRQRATVSSAPRIASDTYCAE